MQRYLLRRLLLMIPMLLLISFVAFVLVNLAPSDPAETALRVNNVFVTDEAVAQMRRSLGLDLPFWRRYADWLQGVLHFDLGRSFLNNRPVAAEIIEALPTTLSLAAVTLFLIIVFSVSLALICVFTVNGKTDMVIRALLFVLTATPNYWAALLLIWGLAVRLNFFPVSGLAEPTGIILPAFALSLGYIGTYVRLIRGAMLNQLRQPYVFYAKARGLPSGRIIFNHVLRNSLHSGYAAVGMAIPKLIAGSVVIENIFALPGIGRLCVQAVSGRDYPVIQGYVLFMASFFLLFNFLTDILQYKLDPRLERE